MLPPRMPSMRLRRTARCVHVGVRHSTRSTSPVTFPDTTETMVSVANSSSCSGAASSSPDSCGRSAIDGYAKQSGLDPFQKAIALIETTRASPSPPSISPTISTSHRGRSSSCSSATATARRWDIYAGATTSRPSSTLRSGPRTTNRDHDRREVGFAHTGCFAVTYRHVYGKSPHVTPRESI